jgi:hypothetical protein
MASPDLWTWLVLGCPDASPRRDTHACPACLRPPHMPDESDRMLHLPPLASLCPACGCNCAPARPSPHMVMHIRTQACTCCCAFRFVTCCAPMRTGGDHPRSCSPRAVAPLASLLCWTPMDVHAGGDQIYICNARSTFATSWWNTCNIHMKHTYETHETYYTC